MAEELQTKAAGCEQRSRNGEREHVTGVVRRASPCRINAPGGAEPDIIT